MTGRRNKPIQKVNVGTKRKKSTNVPNDKSTECGEKKRRMAQKEVTINELHSGSMGVESQIRKGARSNESETNKTASKRKISGSHSKSVEFAKELRFSSKDKRKKESSAPLTNNNITTEVDEIIADQSTNELNSNNKRSSDGTNLYSWSDDDDEDDENEVLQDNDDNCVRNDDEISHVDVENSQLRLAYSKNNCLKKGNNTGSDGTASLHNVSNSSRSVANFIPVSTPNVIGRRLDRNKFKGKPNVESRSNIPFTSLESASETIVHKKIEMLEETIKKNHAEFLNQMSRMENIFRGEIGEVRKQLIDQRSEIAEVKMISSTSDILKRNSRNEKQKDLDSSLILFDAVFSENLIQLAVETCCIGQILKLVQDMDSEDYASSAAISIMVLQFSVMPSETRERYYTEIGVSYSKYRKGLITTTVRAAQKNTLGVFNTSDQQFEPPKIVTEDDIPIKPKQPDWIKPGFIRSNHIEFGRIKNEELATRKKGKVKEEVSKKDAVARHACGRLFSLFNAKLHNCRDNARLGIFSELFYLFSDWNQNGGFADQRSMKLKWKNNDDSDMMIELNKIPETKVRKRSSSLPQNFLNFNSDSCEYNSELMKSLCHDHREMILEVSHEVCIEKQVRNEAEETFNNGTSTGEHGIENSFRRNNNSPHYSRKNRIENERKIIKRKINCIAVAARYIAGYTGMGQFTTPSSVLGSHVGSLKAVYAVATFIRDWVSNTMTVIEENGTIEVLQHKRGLMKEHGIHVEELLPPPSKQEPILRRTCLRMSLEEFEKINVDDNTTVEGNDDAIVDGDILDLSDTEGFFDI